MAVNARIKSKHDTTANWNAATGFIPLAGEIIIYDDYKTITTTNQFGEETTIVVNFQNRYKTDVELLQEQMTETQEAIADLAEIIGG